MLRYDIYIYMSLGFKRLISVFVYSCFRPRIERRMCAQVMSGIIAEAIDTNVTAGKGIVLKRFII